VKAAFKVWYLANSHVSKNLAPACCPVQVTEVFLILLFTRRENCQSLKVEDLRKDRRLTGATGSCVADGSKWANSDCARYCEFSVCAFRILSS
jgi:hypothetical protein